MNAKLCFLGLLIAWSQLADSAGLAVRVADTGGRPLTDAVVFVPGVASAPASKPQNLTSVVQRGRVFDPFVTVVQQGAAVSFPNEDTVMHHVYSFSPAKRFEIKLYKGTPPSPITFDGLGVVVLGCNVHDWMLAYILVLDTAAYAKSDAKGHARIVGVPAGTHELWAWYPGMRSPVRLRQVTVAPDESVPVDVRLDVVTKTRQKAPPYNPMGY